ncbi:MAG: reverse transcriptase [Deltaproteobacteria bacterium]|nr:reverse transcriptase [Deltaproteobacteria bacterium]
MLINFCSCCVNKMKRSGQLLEKIADYDNLLLAFWSAQRGKQAKAEVVRFRDDLGRQVSHLRQGLLDGSVNVEQYHYFKIHDPKERLICAASFRDRVLHHAIMNICEPCFESYLIDDTYACRKGKGSHKAVARAQHFCRSSRWFISLDIRKYFDSIDHGILQNLLERRFKDKRLLQLFEKIIGSYATAPGKGVPIGNLTSQYFANHYLGLLDHFIKEQLRIKPYVRYMDNFILWSEDRRVLKESLRAIGGFLRERLALTLNDDICLNQTAGGMNFLGYRVFANIIRLSKRSKKRFSDKFRAYEACFLNGEWSEQVLQKHMQPLIAFAQYAHADNFRRNVIERFGAVS